MSYIEQNLLKNENIIVKGKVTPLIFVNFILWMLLILPFGFLLPGLYFIIFLVALIKTIIIFLTTEIVVTNFRIIAKSGWISIDQFELQVKKLESVSTKITFLGRILNYGHVTFHGTGSASNAFKYIKDANEFKKEASDASNQY